MFGLKSLKDIKERFETDKRCTIRAIQDWSQRADGLNSKVSMNNKKNREAYLGFNYKSTSKFKFDAPDISKMRDFKKAVDAGKDKEFFR